MKRKILLLSLILMITLSCGCNKKEKLEDNNIEENNITSTEQENKFLYPDKIKKQSYTIDEVTSNFSFRETKQGMLAFTETEDIRLYDISEKSTSYMPTLNAYVKNSNLWIRITPDSEYYTVNEIIDNYKKDSSYKIIEINDNSVIAFKKDSSREEYRYTTNIYDEVITFEYNQYTDDEQISQDEIVSIFKKIPSCFSINNDIEYIFDKAILLDIPYNNTLKSHNNIQNVYKDGIQIVTNPKDSEKWEIYYITILYNLKEDVKLENVSKNPKIDKYIYNNSNDRLFEGTWFRVYDNDKTYDTKLFYSAYNDIDESIKDINSALKGFESMKNK